MNSSVPHVENGTIFKGMWSKNMLNGFGKQIWPNGDRFVGQWAANRREGQGTISFKATGVEIECVYDPPHYPLFVLFFHRYPHPLLDPFVLLFSPMANANASPVHPNLTRYSIPTSCTPHATVG